MTDAGRTPPRHLAIRHRSGRSGAVIRVQIIRQDTHHPDTCGRYRPRIRKLRRSKDWRDLGALKVELLDLTIMERNRHAKTVVLDVKAQRREGLGVITIRPGPEALLQYLPKDTNTP